MCERIGKNVRILVFMCVLLVIPVCGLEIGKQVRAAETEEQLSKEDYEKKFEEVVSLVNLMLADETFVNNKTYTAEQEKDLEAIITEVTQSHFVKSSLLKAELFAQYIRSHMTLDSRQQTTTWQMLCDGDTMGKFGKPQSYGNSENYVHAFRDLCVLEDIPCFMLKNEKSGNTIAMFYAETGWNFLDVADPEGVPVVQTKVYETFYSSFEPQMITFEYDVLNTDVTSLQYVADIYIDKEAMQNKEDSNLCSFYLYYDTENNMVKMANGKVLTDEIYYGTNQKSNENGEPPKGWVEAVKYYSTTEITVYRGYSLFGVALRGRIQVDGKEYTTELCDLVNIPYGYIAENREQTEEEKQYVKNYNAKNCERLKRIAETLYQDKTFIFDTKFTEEEEAFMREAVKEATSRKYLETKRETLELVGCTLPPEGEPLSDQLKAYGILWYIRDHVEYAEMLLQNSYSVLKSGYAVCGGYALLMQDMCTLSGIPCFMLGCGISPGISGKNFSDHGYNMLRLDGKWYFADPTNFPVIRELPFYETSRFLFGYDTLNVERYYISKEYLLKEIYPVEAVGYFYDFDENGQLGVYKTSRNDLIRNATSGNDNAGFYGTDSNGKLAYGNGFFSFEKLETNDGVQELYRYEGYMQQGHTLQGKTVIDGKEYNFDCMLVWRDGDTYNGCIKELLKRQYLISHLDFSTIPDQEYTGKAICPEPVIKHGEKVLTLGVDYTIAYKDNTEITNDYSVHTSYTVEGMGDYAGTAIRYFNIVKKDISNMEVGFSKTAYSWDLEAQKTGYLKPEILFDLQEQEYTVRYENNNTAGTATAVITGKNHCYGTTAKEFQISPAVLDEKYFKIVTFDGKELEDAYECENGSTISIEPEVAIRWYNEDGTEFVRLNSNDYTVSYENADKFGNATIRVQGMGRFSGILEKHFTITEKGKTDISQNQEFMDVMQGKLEYGLNPRRYSAVYTGKPVLPQIPGITYVTPYTPQFGGMKKDVDFVVNVSDNINAGEGTLTVQGIGNYTGTVTITFDILPKEIKRADVELVVTRVPYNGTVQPPKATVSGLTEGIDFTFVCQKWSEDKNVYETVEPVNAGYYSVAIRLLNPNYTFDDCVADEDGYCRVGYEIMAVGLVPTSVPSKVPVATPGAEDTTNNPENTKTPSGQVTTPTKKPSATDKPATTTKPKAAVPKVAKVTKCKVVNKKKGFVVIWKKVSGAKGYQIQISTRKNFEGAKSISVKASKTSYRFSKRKSGQKYYIRIRAYKTYKEVSQKAKKVYGKWVTITKKQKIDK